MNRPALRLSIVDSVAHLALDSPPKNELDFRTLQELSLLCQQSLSALPVQGMLIYGAGRHFSSGANIDELTSLYKTPQRNDPAAFYDQTSRTFLAIENLPFPVIAIVNGCCLGLGLELALACHYRIASTRAVFGLPESTFGLMPGCGGTIRLQRHVATGKSIELILSGRCIGPEEALETGLVHACLPKNELMAAAAALIRRITYPVGD